jgi:hypothetical protein
MSETKIRSSKQLYIDAALDLQTQKMINVVDPTANQDAATKKYVDDAVSGVVAAADAMVYKGTIGTGGTYTIAAFNALVIYNAGWTFRIIEAGTIKGVACEIGDIAIALYDRASGGVNGDWTFAQNNIDGAVIKADYTANSILASNAASSPAAVTVAEQTFVGRKTGGNIAALTPAEARTILNVADAATANAKATGAEIDTGTDDVKFATPKAIRDSGLLSGAVAGELNALTDKATPVDADVIMIEDSAASYGKKKLTIANLKAVLTTVYNALYEKVANKDATGGYVGLTLFKINFKNAANSFTSFFTNANTAARTYTFADRDGTIADNTDITAAKARGNHTGTQTAATISDFAAAALAAAPAETVTTIGNLIGTTAAAKATPVDADELGFSDSAAAGVLKSMTFANLKAFLVTYFNTLYNNYIHPHHSGDVVSVNDGATTIQANVVSNTKLADMATQTFKGRNTAATGDPEDLSITTVKTMLGLNTENQSSRVYRASLARVDATSHTITVANFISNSEEVFRNGILLDNLGNDYSLSYVANVIEIILVTGLATDEKLRMNYSYSV